MQLQLARIKSAPTAEYLLELVLGVLDEATGLPRAKLDTCTKLTGIGCDGASVNMGVDNGLFALLQRRYALKLRASHCAAHRTSLSASAMSDNVLISKLEAFVQHLSSFYSAR